MSDEEARDGAANGEGSEAKSDTPPGPADDAQAETAPAAAPAAATEADSSSDDAPPPAATAVASVAAAAGGGASAAPSRAGEGEATEVAAREAEGEHAPPSDRAKAERWGLPLVRLDATWTRFEQNFAVGVLLLEIIALAIWVVLKGMGKTYDPAAGNVSKAGIVLRAMFGAVVLGSITWRLLASKGERVRNIGTSAAVLFAFVIARSWANVGALWSSNLLNWYQQASSVALFGGVNGLGRRLTMLLVLLGGSLATAAGKHITIDVVTRFFSKPLRRMLTIVGWFGTSIICFSAAWGFLDHVAIADFEAKKEMSVGEKLGTISHGVGEDFWLLRKQVALDFKAFPQVVKGVEYAKAMTNDEWNAWLVDAGFVERFGAQKTDLVKAHGPGTHSPFVVVPGKGEMKGRLVSTANLIFPLGLFIIGLRFILLALLTLSGHRDQDAEGHLDVGVKDRAAGEPEPQGGAA